MKSHIFGLCAGLGCLLATACGSDKSSSAAPAAACTPITDTALLAAGFSDTAVVPCSPSMYAKYGDAGFQVVNENIGKLALAAPTDKLGDSFQTKIADANATRKAEFGAHLLSFLESAFGNPNAYVGPDMVSSHAHLDITVAQYQYFISDVVVPALKTSGVDPNDITNCFAPAVLNKSFVKTVVTCQ